MFSELFTSVKPENANVWKKVVSTSKLLKFQNQSHDSITIKKLETSQYEIGSKYQVNYNKYVLGIFRKKCQALEFVKRWMKLHS